MVLSLSKHFELHGGQLLPLIIIIIIPRSPSSAEPHIWRCNAQRGLTVPAHHAFKSSIVLSCVFLGLTFCSLHFRCKTIKNKAWKQRILNKIKAIKQPSNDIQFQNTIHCVNDLEIANSWEFHGGILSKSHSRSLKFAFLFARQTFLQMFKGSKSIAHQEAQT